MSSPLESFCAETGSSTGLFHTREDFSLKNIQKMDVTADSCILELCCALHLNQAVQGLSIHSSMFCFYVSNLTVVVSSIYGKSLRLSIKH